MEKNAGRMAGSTPVWEMPRGERQRMEQSLTAALTGDTTRDANFAAVMAYQNPQGSVGGEPSQEFGFADLIDMVNPLQHIPVVSHFYRELTGDTIKPIAQIVGGAVFGGPVGAAGGLVNAVIEEETGRDITGNAFALLEGEEIRWQNTPVSEVSLAEAAPITPVMRETLPKMAASTQVDELAALAPAAGDAIEASTTPPLSGLSGPTDPEIALTNAALDIERAAYQALPPTMLGFVDSGAAAPARAETREQRSVPVIHNNNGSGWRKYERYND